MTKTKRFRLQVTQAASRDISAIAAWSAKEFGAAAALRYETLVFQGLRDIESDPDRLGVRARTELGDPVRTYHLESSRHHVPRDEQVRRPRHYFVYRLKDDLVEVLRLLHDAQDADRHLPREEA